MLSRKIQIRIIMTILTSHNIYSMTDFLDKFKGRTSRIGKEGLLQLLDHDFKPISLGEEASPNKGINSYASKNKSIQLHKATPRVQVVELPPVKLNLKQKLRLQSLSPEGQGSNSTRRAASRVSQLIKQRQQELVEDNKASPLRKRNKNSISPTKMGGRVSPFENVPDEFQSYEIPQDEMRFLKSFERYTKSRHFTIHRKMSQRFEQQE